MRLDAIKVALCCGALMLTACSNAPGLRQDAAAPAASGSAKAAPEPAASEAAKPSPAAPAAISVPAGTALRIRLDQAVSTKTHSEGAGFSGTLSAPVVIAGNTVIPAGAAVRGTVVGSDPSGRLKGRPVLAIALTSVELDGKSVPLKTQAVSRVGARARKRNLTWIGAVSGAGAAIGAIAGGGKGAAIGAGAGAAAGTAGAAVTGQRHLTLPAETPVTFKLSGDVPLPRG